MKIRHICGFAVVAILLFVPTIISQSAKDASSGFFSANAVLVGREQCAISPDGGKDVCVRLLDDNADDFPASVRVKTEHGLLESRIRHGLNAQVLWSPDSKSFALTGSVVGANGQYQTDAFLVQAKRLVKVPLTTLIERAFGHPVKCLWPESPNVVAVQWVKPSQQLLIAAQIIHHTNCDSFGAFKAYSVDISSRRVVKAYNQLTAKRLFSDSLGPWLRDADDTCTRDPAKCRVNP